MSRQWEPRHIKDQKKAQSEERKGKQHQDYMKVVRALYRIRQQQQRANKNQQSAEAQKCFREWLTLILLFITVVFTVLAYRGIQKQLKIADDTLSATKSQADAAWQQVGDYEKDRMALVIAAGAEIHVHRNAVNVDFVFTNTGATPTRKLQWFSFHRCGSQERPNEPPCTKWIEPRDAVIAPGATIRDWHTHFGLREINVDLKRKGSNEPHLAGWIAYDDISDKPHRTYFCYELQPIPGSDPGYFTCKDLPPCTDEECDRDERYDKQMAEAFKSVNQPIPQNFLPLNMQKAKQ